eukprot:scaffold131958_cov31-Tisochrysis_lutea.AAC.2
MTTRARVARQRAVHAAQRSERAARSGFHAGCRTVRAWCAAGRRTQAGRRGSACTRGGEGPGRTVEGVSRQRGKAKRGRDARASCALFGCAQRVHLCTNRCRVEQARWMRIKVGAARRQRARRHRLGAQARQHANQLAPAAHRAYVNRSAAKTVAMRRRGTGSAKRCHDPRVAVGCCQMQRSQAVVIGGTRIGARREQHTDGVLSHRAACAHCRMQRRPARTVSGVQGGR